MTREEAYNRIDAIIAKHEIDDDYVTITSFLDYDALRMARSSLEQDPYDFARWVAEEIFDENWEYNKDAFEELACRKLAKMGIVKANGDKWELVESMESEDKECR